MEGKLRDIDFLVVGAHRCGTTSLFKYLSAHPDIFMPARKELFFFNRGDRYCRGKEWYLKEFFSGAKPHQIMGEASPEYMLGGPCLCIKKTFPYVKIIAILRNPVDRLFSHKRFDERKKLGPNLFFQLCLGYYGKALENYSIQFPPSQIKVIFLEELEQAPYRVMRDVFEFLGVSDYRSKIFGKRFNPSGVKRFPKTEEFFYRHRGPINFIKKVLPERMWGAVSFWFETSMNLKEQINYENIYENIDRASFVRYYKPDVRKLEGLIGRKVPWEEFRDED